MFLSKKNAIYFNKPKQQETTKPKRILGGTLIRLNQAGKTMSSKKTTKSTTRKNNKSNPKYPVKIYCRATTSLRLNRHPYRSKRSIRPRLRKFITLIGMNLMPKMTCNFLSHRL